MALVTGAGKRVGSAIAKRLHADGFCVCLHYYSSGEGVKALCEVMNRDRAGSAVCVYENLCQSDPSGPSLGERCRSLVEKCVQLCGGLDVLVNNSAMYAPTPLTTSSDFGAMERVAGDMMSLNAVSPLYLTQAFAHWVQKEKSDQTPVPPPGRCIVNIIDSMIGLPSVGFTAYTMSKHALLGLTKAAAVELAPFSVRVNAVSPGLSIIPEALSADQAQKLRRTVPLNRAEGGGEEVAAAVSYLAGASYVSGAILPVDGAWRLSCGHEGSEFWA